MPDKLDKTIQDVRVRQNVETRTGYLGRGDGFPYDTSIPGNFWVRFKLGDRYTKAVSIRLDPNADVELRDGYPVEVGKDNKGQDVILRADSATLILAQQAPPNTRSNDPAQSVNQNLLLNQFYFARHRDTTNEPLTVSVWPNFGYNENEFSVLGGLKIALDDPAGDSSIASLVPGADEHCWAVVFCRVDNVLEAYASTAQSIGQTIDLFAALNECAAQATDGSQPICARYLADDQAALDDEEDKWVDLRQVINLEWQRTASVTTTDATETTVVSIPVDEGAVLTITGRVTAYISDLTAACGGTFTAVVRRAVGGNVALVGSVTADVHDDSGTGSPTFTVDVDTGTQTARIRWTGVASEDWTARTKYEVLRTLAA